MSRTHLVAPLRYLPKLDRPKRVMLLGATGTAGRAALAALLQRGHHVTCFVRARKEGDQSPPAFFNDSAFAAADFRFGDPAQADSLKESGFRREAFDAIVSCLASRTGAPADAWAIDYRAHSQALQVGIEAGVSHMVLLSAICVQKPKLAFQFAKLAFEKELMESGVTYSIVRPTALFKSLSGQIERLRNGKSFLLFGNGELTSCKPISDQDLGSYLALCLENEELQNRILPIGGPGPAVTSKQLGNALFELLGKKPSYTHVPVAMLDMVIACLTFASVAVPALARKAEFARIGRYYATESMLHFDPVAGHYDEAATPSTGSDHIFDHYARIVSSGRVVERNEHSVY